MDFTQLNLSTPILKSLQDQGFTTPTPIQAKTLEATMAGQDMIACAETGSGKTAAFVIPTVELLQAEPEMTALVLVPTRELASQVELVCRAFTKYVKHQQLALVIGGVPMERQFKALRNRPRIIVATPGRLCDHLRRRSVDLRKVGILVLDEADRMLDMGFAPQLNEILRSMPQPKQTLLYSATLPQDIRKIAAKFMKSPMEVTIGERSQKSSNVKEIVLKMPNNEKNNSLIELINARQEGSILIFARTKHRTDRVARYLDEYGLEVARLHGDRSQSQRERAIKGFRSGEFRILVATDIAARGLDISHVKHVVNYDLPQCPEDYIHRIGRTGRAGRTGEALSFVTPEDKGKWRDIERLLKRTQSPQQNANHQH